MGNIGGLAVRKMANTDSGHRTPLSGRDTTHFYAVAIPCRERRGSLLVDPLGGFVAWNGVLVRSPHAMSVVLRSRMPPMCL
jgi:hypothetical protein